ncbi:hypothetical protein [Natronorubrum sp. DTA28]|uniref:hypothetical protein n=1 Tax=Natronorubrum sp. DTA28 TaxID=3447019 RepID=UPI003F86864A
MKPQFKATRDGVEIIDPIDRHRNHFIIHGPVSLQDSNQDYFPYPVDSTVEVKTNRITLPVINPVYAYDGNKMVTDVQPDEQLTLPSGEYTLDISLQIKVYIHFEGSVKIYSDTDRTHIELSGLTRVMIGARSHHTRPAGTITTTADPSNVMQAVSSFGSALKTTTTERSFPTMRGHPPTIRLGDELTIPDGIDSPETGVILEIPPTLSHIFVSAPLVYYLGADVVSGTEPRLCTKDGFSYSLDTADKFERTVERTLQQLFFFDCIVRGEGKTSLPLFERQQISEQLEFDPSVLYEQSLSEQVKSYLGIPFSVIEPYLPEWRLKTQIEPTPDVIPFLPFIANDLSLVSVQDGTGQSNQPLKEQSHVAPDNKQNVPTISSADNQSSITTIDQSWHCSRGSEIESIAPVSAYHNGIKQSPQENPIKIHVVCNDPNMNEELIFVNSIYGKRDMLPFNVEIHHELTSAELEDVLTRESDFIHYIGHIDSSGFRCSDGLLDIYDLNTVGTKSFFLNACKSYEQGLQLIEAGGISGIVTMNDVKNDDAVNTGGIIARLLNSGFSFYAAVDIIRRVSEIGNQYHVVGNGRLTVAQPENGVPNTCVIDTRGRESKIEIYNYILGNKGMGTVSIPYLESIDTHHLLPKKIGPLAVTKPQLVQFFEKETMPVLLNNELCWSDEITLRDLN